MAKSSSDRSSPMDATFLVSRFNRGGVNSVSRFSATLFGGGGASFEESDTIDPGYRYTCGGECRGLLYFDPFFSDVGARITIYNPTTKEKTLLPLSPVTRDADHYFGGGFGYDESSQDFKIVRFFRRYNDVSEGCGAEIYSLKENCWKSISCPQNLSSVSDLSNKDDVGAAHVNGNLYWAALFLDTNEENAPISIHFYGGTIAVLRFNLAEEVFSTFPTPYPIMDYRLDHPTYQDLFELDGKLGAFVYKGLESITDYDDFDDSNTDKELDDSDDINTDKEPDDSNTDNRRIKVHVWEDEEVSWKEVLDIPLGNALRPLELRDNLLFLQGKTIGNLQVYHVTTKRLELLYFYACNEHMRIFPYIRSLLPLPEYDADSISESDDEEMDQNEIPIYNCQQAAIRQTPMDMNFLVHWIDEQKTDFLTLHSLTLPLSEGGGSSKEQPALCLRDFGPPHVDAFLHYVGGSECRGFLYFDRVGIDGIFICDPATKQQLKTLPPSLPPSQVGKGDGFFCGSGFGYDDTSEDFKIISFFQHGDGKGDYLISVEIYSFKKKCWKQIDFPEDRICIDPRVGTHVNGNLYWASPLTNTLVSFDLASEKFSLFGLPFFHNGKRVLSKYCQHLFDLDGRLGAFVFEFPYPGVPKKHNTIQIWLWEERSWKLRNRIEDFDDNVRRPLYLKHDVLFLEVKSSNEKSQLQVCDLATNKLKLLDVYAYEGKMEIFPYTPSTCSLPEDAEPLEINT